MSSITDQLNMAVYYVRQGYGVEVSMMIAEGLTDEGIELNMKALQILGFKLMTADEALEWLNERKEMFKDPSFTAPF